MKLQEYAFLQSLNVTLYDIQTFQNMFEKFYGQKSSEKVDF